MFHFCWTVFVADELGRICGTSCIQRVAHQAISDVRTHPYSEIINICRSSKLQKAPHRVLSYIGRVVDYPPLSRRCERQYVQRFMNGTARARVRATGNSLPNRANRVLREAPGRICNLAPQVSFVRKGASSRLPVRASLTSSHTSDRLQIKNGGAQLDLVTCCWCCCCCLVQSAAAVVTRSLGSSGAHRTRPPIDFWHDGFGLIAVGRHTGGKRREG